MIPSNVLVVHGPNLSLYKNNAGLPILDTEINPYLAGDLGMNIEIIQTNDISSIIDVLSSNPEFYDAMIINLDYAHNKCEDLANTIKLLDLSTIEINTRLNRLPSQLKDITTVELPGTFRLNLYQLAINYLLSG